MKNFAIPKKVKGVKGMQNYDTSNESKFFEKLMADGQRIKRQEEEKCKNCSYEICDECQIRKGVKQ